jgi:hypothetical protein
MIMILYRVDVYANQRLRALDEERKAHLKKPRIEASNAWKSFDLSECNIKILSHLVLLFLKSCMH